jgi:putative transcriptional regulator
VSKYTQVHENPRAVDDLLAAYGAGSLDPARHALVATHLLLKPENRRFVRMLENVVAADLLAERAGSVSRRDARLAAIFDCEDAPAASPAHAADGGVLPEPLRRYMGCDLKDVSWSFVVPGVRECRLGEVGRGTASLLRVRAGRRLPQHTHEGSEITLVLTGAFSDPLGRYMRGDIAVADAAIDHSPEVDSDEDCICFAVTDAPLVLTSPLGRVVQRIFAMRH